MKIVRSYKSKDGKTTKYLQKTTDGNIIETGYYNLDEHIVCISSQVGCSMGCTFCATTDPIDNFKPTKKFVRNLTAKEIVQQVGNVLKVLKPKALSSKRVLLSFMGMGEPFLNYQNVVRSIEGLSNDFPNSRATVATLGIAPEKMREIAHKEFPILLKLHLSLHAPSDKLRKKILPKAGEIKPSLEALKHFLVTKKVPVKVNYILIRDLNDFEIHAVQLAELLKSYSFIVKLSKLNPYKDLKLSAMAKFNVFEKTLHSYGIETCRFISTGTDIKAGCGQLRRHFYST